MKATNITGNKATIEVSIDELSFLCNAINETLEAVEEWEFQTLERVKRESEHWKSMHSVRKYSINQTAHDDVFEWVTV